MKLPRLTIIFILIFACIPIIFIASAKTLQVATIQYPPYQYKGKDKQKGLVVEIVVEVFKNMNQPIKIKVYPWARAIKGIKNGNIDGFFTAYKRPERELFADYSKQVLMDQQVSFFVKTNSRISYNGNLIDMKKYTFGLVKGFSYGTSFDNAIKSNIITKNSYANHLIQNVNKLKTNRIDILVSDKYVAYSLFAKEGLQNQYKELKPPVQSIPSYFIFSKHQQLSKTRDKFDTILAKMKKDGVYDEIIAEYFNK